MPKYLSGRTKRTPQSALTDERYKYLTVGESEPNLGDPVSPGDFPPFGQQYQMISVEGYPGQRYWIPVGGGIIPGSISIFEEGSLVGGLSSTTQLNFIGNAITAEGISGPNPGLAVTITFVPPGNNTEIIFKDSGDFQTSSKLTFNPLNGLVRAGDQIQVGIGGSIITSTSDGLVGIGTTIPTQKLHVQGDLRLTGTIYDYLNRPGVEQDLLIKNSLGGLIWIGQQSLRTGAGGTYTNVQYHNSAGIVDGASNFVFDDINNRVGIGSTIPNYLLDVLGDTRIVGDTIINGNINVSGISTFGAFIDANGGAYIDNIRIGITNDNEIDTSIGDLTLDSNSGFTIIDDNLRVSGILTAQGNVDLGSSPANTISLIGNVDTNIIPSTSLTQNLGASDARWNLYVNDIYGTENSSFTLGNLNVLGITTLGSDFSDTVDINARVRTDIIPSQNYTYNLGSPSFRWDSIYADELYANLFVGIANTALTIRTQNNSSSGTNYLTFVDSDNTTLLYENLYTSSNIKYIPITGSLEFNNLTLLGNASVSGIATFTDDVIFGNDSNFDEVTFNSRISSSFIPSLTENFDLGSSNLKWNNVYAITFYGQFIGNAETASALENSRNISITGDLSWNVDFDGSTNVTGEGTLSNTGVVADTYGNVSSYPVITVDSKGRITSASEQLVDFANATVLNSDNIKTVSNNSPLSFFIPFARSNVGSAGTYQALYTDVDITYNPNTNLLSVPNVSIGNSLTVLNNSYFGSDIADTVVFNGLIDSNFVPNVDISYNLGSANRKWSQLHVNEIFVTSTINGVIQYADQIKTTASDANQPHYLTFVVDANDATGAYEELHTDEGLYYDPFDNKLTTSNIDVSTNLIVNGSTTLGNDNTDTVTFNASVNSNIIPSGVSGTHNLGSTLSRWNNVWATTFNGRFVGTADNALQVSTGSTTATTVQYLTFVNNNNDPRGNEYLYTDSSINYNLSTDLLSVPNVSISGNTTLGDVNTDTVTFNAVVNSNIIPSGASGTYDLGSTSSRWNNVWATTFNGRFAGTADAASQVSVGNTTATTVQYLTFVNNNNDPRGNEYLYTDSSINYNPSTDLLSVAKIKPGVIQDSGSSVGQANYVLTVTDANGTLAWAPAATASGAAAIGGITIENPINTIVGNQLGITTVGFSTNFSASSPSVGEVNIDLASSINVTTVNSTSINATTTNSETINASTVNATTINNTEGGTTTINNIVPIGGITVQDDNSTIPSGGELSITTLNFGTSLTVVDDTNGKVTINANVPTSIGSASVSAATNGTYYPIFVTGTGNSLQLFNSTGFSLSISSGIPNLIVNGDITAFASDIRLKTNIKIIDNAIEKVNLLSGFTYNFNELGEIGGFDPNIRHSGVSAQEVERVLPEAVAPAPFNNDYLTVKYEKIIPLLIEAIKEQSKKIDTLEKKVQSLGG